LDDIEALRKWVKNNPDRLKEKQEKRVERLERCLLTPKHMMDTSKHIEHKQNIEEKQAIAFEIYKQKKVIGKFHY
jgi:hypothetical protein